MTTRTTKTAENAAETGKDVAKDAAETSKEVARDAAETSRDVAKDATRRVESLVADTQRSVSENLEKFTKGIEGLTSFNQEIEQPVVWKFALRGLTHSGPPC